MKVTIDGPSAWIAVVGGFVMQFTVIGYLRSTGILMREFQAYFMCSSTLILFVTSVTVSLINILSPAYSLLSRRVQLRWIVVSSGLAICVSMCLLFGAFSLPLWVACLGFCMGACLSACYSSVICKVNECFHRRRDLANGFCFAGSSAGAIAMPVLFTHLADRYSVAGCCLLIGGYFLHLVIAGMLMPTGVSHRGGGTEQQQQQQQPEQQRPAHRKKIKKVSATEAATHYSSVGSSLFNSELAIGSSSRVDNGDSRAEPQSSSSGGWLLAKLTPGQRRLMLIYMAATMLSNLGFTTQYVVFPLFLAEFSVPNATTAVLVAVNGLSDLTSRVLTGYLSDRYRWRRSNVTIVGMTTFGIACAAVANIAGCLRPGAGGSNQRLTLFAAYAVVSGASGGVYMSIVTSVLVGFVGIANLSLVHSIVCCSWTLVVFPGQTLLGYLTDRTGTYKYSLMVTGACMICASLVLLLERLVKRDDVAEELQTKAGDARSRQHQREDSGPSSGDALVAKNGTATR